MSHILFVERSFIFTLLLDQLWFKELWKLCISFSNHVFLNVALQPVSVEWRWHTHGRMPALSKNVVFNQSNLMQRCWENKQPTLNPPQLHMSPSFFFPVVVLCQGSALMSCMHSCREGVLPFLLSLLATIAAVKKTNKTEKALVFAGASKLSRGQNHFEAFMLCQLWQTGIGQILACGIWWSFSGCFLLPQMYTITLWKLYSLLCCTKHLLAEAIFKLN